MASAGMIVVHWYEHWQHLFVGVDAKILWETRCILFQDARAFIQAAYLKEQELQP